MALVAEAEVPQRDRPALNVGERLDRLPLDRFHWRILWLIGAGLFVDVYDQILGGAVLAALVKSGESNLTLNGYFFSATFLGLMIGAWWAGVISDRYGRRVSFQINLLIFGLGSLASAFAPSMTWLIALRFITCIGLGAEVVVASSTLMEFMPTRLRGRQVAVISLTSSLGALAANAAGYFIIPSFGWQWMFVLAAVGALVVWFLRQALPESPRWLESKGRYEEAERVVRMIEGGRHQTCAPIGTSVPEAKPEVSSLVLFSKPVIRRTLLAVALNLAIQVSTWIVTGWVPSFLIAQGLTVSSSLGIASLMSLGSLFGTFVAIAVVERIGRKTAIITALLLGAVFAAVFPFSPNLPSAVASGILLSAMIYLLIALAYNLYVNEIFPTEFRQRGTGFAIASGRFVLVLSPYLIVPLYQSGGTLAVFPIIIVLNLIAVAAMVAFGVETRGRSLEAISSQVSRAVSRS
ncbi:MAG TPA: MFS transporter [Enterovirga sp.]|jgi:putative MFS transporter